MVCDFRGGAAASASATRVARPATPLYRRVQGKGVAGVRRFALKRGIKSEMSLSSRNELPRRKIKRGKGFAKQFRRVARALINLKESLLLAKSRARVHKRHSFSPACTYTLALRVEYTRERRRQPPSFEIYLLRELAKSGLGRIFGFAVGLAV